MGGRQVRTGPEYGHIYDHFAVDYEYPNGVHVAEHVPADRRAARTTSPRPSSAPRGSWHEPAATAFDRREPSGGSAGKEVNPYVQEHIDLIASIRAGKPLNELKTSPRAP